MEARTPTLGLTFLLGNGTEIDKELGNFWRYGVLKEVLKQSQPCSLKVRPMRANPEIQCISIYHLNQGHSSVWCEGANLKAWGLGGYAPTLLFGLSLPPSLMHVHTHLHHRTSSPRSEGLLICHHRRAHASQGLGTSSGRPPAALLGSLPAIPAFFLRVS